MLSSKLTLVGDFFMKQKGTVKWYDERKGYGFIVPDGEKKDIFCHNTNIENANRLLEPGEIVEFEVANGKKGPEAVKVRSATEG
jgi:CspA family cold shock protein